MALRLNTGLDSLSDCNQTSGFSSAAQTRNVLSKERYDPFDEILFTVIVAH